MFVSNVLLSTILSLHAPAATPDDAVKEPFPGVRINEEERWVEFDGIVPISAHDPEAPNVFLELIVCTLGTKEHEALVMTETRPSHLHAALLLLGAEPGHPGSWSWDQDILVPHNPEGPQFNVELIYENEEGKEVRSNASTWVKHFRTGEKLPERPWVFAGSRLVDRGRGERYDADGAGVVVGLTTFGSEVLAWPETFSPDSGVEEPVWIADARTTPPYETVVRVRATLVE